jgi:hypothetical protein
VREVFEECPYFRWQGNCHKGPDRFGLAHAHGIPVKVGVKSGEQLE